MLPLRIRARDGEYETTLPTAYFFDIVLFVVDLFDLRIALLYHRISIIREIGKEIKRYQATWAKRWLIATFPALRLNIDDYPAIKKGNYLVDSTTLPRFGGGR